MGKGVRLNYKAALKWYKLAAIQRHARAQAVLGYMHQLGKGITQNYKTALKWYKLAAEQGNHNAQ